MVEHLLWKHKALSLNPISSKKERKEGRERGRKEGRKEGREEKLKARVNEDTLCPNVSRLQTLCQAPRLQEFLGPPKRDS
jgi:hypothetical protein